MTIHHLAFDGSSFDPFMRELCATYDARIAGELLPFPISDFNMRILRIGSADASITPLYLRLFWSTGRDNWTACLLSSDCPGIGHRHRRAQRRGGYLRFVLSNEVGLAIHRLSQNEGVTPFMILLAAFQTLLYRYSGQDDIVVGAPAANRSRTELDEAIGLFANVVALRTSLADRPSFWELLARVRSVVLAAFRHQELPFEVLVKSLELDRDPLPLRCFKSCSHIRMSPGPPGNCGS